jgi:transcriptional regulator with XRE-family HTH domain
MDNRAQVREFLASRRARITPDQAGLPAYGGNRRVKGLRREEVALLAGISVDYYIRIERGDLAGTSEAVLDGVANALQLDEAEREHLQALARFAGPTATRRARPSPTTVRPVFQQVLDAITEAPAWIRNARHDILATNPLARALYSPVLDSGVAGATAKRAANTTRFIYLDPAAREFFIDYDRIATDAAAMLRLEAGRNPHDKDLITLVGELSTRCGTIR